MGRVKNESECQSHFPLVVLVTVSIVGVVCFRIISQPIDTEIGPEVMPVRMVNEPEHHLIMAGGMTQSGSTLQYNILRILLESANLDDFVSGYIWNVDSQPRHKYALLKCHDCMKVLDNPDWTTRLVFTCHRDVRDVWASRREKGYGSTSETVKKLVGFHEAISQRADSDWHYEDVIMDGEKFVHEAAASLNQKIPGIHIGEVDAAGILARILNAASRVDSIDKETMKNEDQADPSQFYKGHIRDGRWGSFMMTMNKTKCLDASKQFADYLRKYHYPGGEVCLSPLYEST